MRVALGGDHGGYELKTLLNVYLKELGHDVKDVGAYSFNPSDDYPDFAIAVSEAITSGQVDRGIVVCGSGVGASIASNKIAGIRASVCHDMYSAHQGVEHDDMNVLCLGSRVVGEELARDLVYVFVRAKFSGEDRHVRRLDKIKDIEG